MKWTVGIVAALLLVIAALWLRHDRGSPRTPPAASTAVAPAPAPAALHAAELGRRAPPSSTPATETPAPLPVATAPPAEPLEQALAQRAYDGFGPRLVNYLARQGLARVDAEPIVVELLGKTVTCALDALREQALEQRVDFDQVLNALEAQLYDADGPLLTALVDVAAVDRRAMSCSMTALTQAGVPPEAAADLFPRRSAPR